MCIPKSQMYILGSQGSASREDHIPHSARGDTRVNKNIAVNTRLAQAGRVVDPHVGLPAACTVTPASEPTAKPTEATCSSSMPTVAFSATVALSTGSITIASSSGAAAGAGSSATATTDYSASPLFVKCSVDCACEHFPWLVHGGPHGRPPTIGQVRCIRCCVRVRLPFRDRRCNGGADSAVRDDHGRLCTQCGPQHVVAQHSFYHLVEWTWLLSMGVSQLQFRLPERHPAPRRRRRRRRT